MRLPSELEKLVREAVDKDASDLFLIPGEPPAMRLHGVVERTDADPLTADAVRTMAEEVIGRENLVQIGPKLARFQQWCGSPGEFNLSICVARSHGDYTISFQIMPTRIFTVDEVRLPPAIVKAANSLDGLIVVSGPTGSGKTTSVYALIDHINATVGGCHICTVEGPSHMLIPAKKALVQQREIGVDAPDALAGIQAAADQDPDVLYVGDVSDVEVLLASIGMADMGHLVIVQMHAPTPEDAINRIIDVFPDPARDVSRRTLARVLRAVSAQILIRSAEGKTRFAAYGVLIPDEEMRQAIAEGRDFMARRTPWPEGCQTIDEHLGRLRAEGLVTDEAVAGALNALAAHRP
jgi:twitching motility protein PilT